MPQPRVAQDNLTFLQRIWHSIFPSAFRPLKDRGDYRRFFNSLILHFRPRNVQERTLRFTLTWGLGGMAVVLIILLFGTGILMKFVYQPFPDKAYGSILYLQRDVLFGQFVRNIHHWSGNILLIVVFLHFLRVFFTGAFHPPRQFNWIIGLCLFLTILMSNFTGYLLPWDQLSFWAITICTGMLEYIPVVVSKTDPRGIGGRDIYARQFLCYTHGTSSGSSHCADNVSLLACPQGGRPCHTSETRGR